MHPCSRCGGSLYDGERAADCAHLVECRKGAADRARIAAEIRESIENNEQGNIEHGGDFTEELERLLRFVERQ
jgi:anti-sigma factor ChrR (cupin superfamily)